MAKRILRDAQVKYKTSGGTTIDLTSQVQAVTVNYSADTPNAPAMDDDTNVVLPDGLKNWSMQITFYQDFSSSAQVDSVLFGEVGKQGEIEVVPDRNSAVSVSNPAYHGLCVLAEWPPFSGSVGDVHTVQGTFNANDTLSRNTTAQL